MKKGITTCNVCKSIHEYKVKDSNSGEYCYYSKCDSCSLETYDFQTINGKLDVFGVNFMLKGEKYSYTFNNIGDKMYSIEGRRVSKLDFDTGFETLESVFTI